MSRGISRGVRGYTMYCFAVAISYCFTRFLDSRQWAGNNKFDPLREL